MSTATTFAETPLGKLCRWRPLLGDGVTSGIYNIIRLRFQWNHGGAIGSYSPKFRPRNSMAVPSHTAIVMAEREDGVEENYCPESDDKLAFQFRECALRVVWKLNSNRLQEAPFDEADGHFWWAIAVELGKPRDDWFANISIERARATFFDMPVRVLRPTRKEVARFLSWPVPPAE